MTPRSIARAAACLLLAGCAHASDPIANLGTRPAAIAVSRDSTVVATSADLQDIRTDVLKMIEAKEIPGMAVAVAQGSDIVWMEGLGYADIADARPMSTDTVFNLASMSKSVSATLLLSLVSDGRIELDDKVDALIAPRRLVAPQGFDHGDVTVRDVLAMTAGIGHGWFGAESYDRIPSQDSLFAWYGQVAFPPGAHAHYANWSLGLADLIVESVTDQTLESYAQARLFGPLGMRTATTRIMTDRYGEAATGYSSGMMGFGLADAGVSVPAGGVGMMASVRDMLRFGMFHAGGLQADGKAPLDRATRQLMHDAEKRGPTYALGFHRTGGPLISNGNTNLFATEMQIFPEDELVIVVLLNRASWDQLPGQIANRIAAVMRGRSTASTMSFDNYVATYETPYDTEAGALEGLWCGEVHDPRRTGGIPARIAVSGGNFQFRYDDGPEVELKEIVFNRVGEFSARAQVTDFMKFEPNEKPAASLLFTLLTQGSDRLSGYIRMDRTEDTYYYALPVIADFRRIDRSSCEE